MDKNRAQNVFSGVDAGKFIFACLIPLLHISFADSNVVFVARQYFSRLGVPFFFAVSGMFLSSSIQVNGNYSALKRYIKRVGIMLISWLIIYSPIFFVTLKDDASVYKLLLFARELLFRTPAFLWYLTSALAASVPFCIFKNRKGLLCMSVVLYMVGTILGGSYSWLSGGWLAYERIFLTTRNGLFFGLPMFCVGELAATTSSDRTDQKKILAGLVVTFALLVYEITMVQNRILPGSDCSMYFALPFFTYFLLRALREARFSFDSKALRRASSAVYVVQFGVITVCAKLFQSFALNSVAASLITWFAVISVGWLLYFVTLKVPKLSFLI